MESEPTAQDLEDLLPGEESCRSRFARWFAVVCCLLLPLAVLNVPMARALWNPWATAVVTVPNATAGSHIDVYYDGHVLRNVSVPFQLTYDLFGYTVSDDGGVRLRQQWLPSDREACRGAGLSYPLGYGFLTFGSLLGILFITQRGLSGTLAETCARRHRGFHVPLFLLVSTSVGFLLGGYVRWYVGCDRAFARDFCHGTGTVLASVTFEQTLVLASICLHILLFTLLLVALIVRKCRDAEIGAHQTQGLLNREYPSAVYGVGDDAGADADADREVATLLGDR